MRRCCTKTCNNARVSRYGQGRICNVTHSFVKGMEINMSSTNKTAALGLNQWVGTDPVLRADFNADNLIVENAVAGLGAGLDAVAEARMVRRIAEITITSAAGQIDLDLSELSLNEWRSIVIFTNFRTNGVNTQTGNVLLNNITATGAYLWTNTNGGTSAVQQAFAVAAKYTNTYRTVWTQYELYSFEGRMALALFQHDLTADHGSSIYTHYRAAVSPTVATVDTLSTINFIAPSGDVFNAGGIIHVYGVKR